MPQDTFPYSQPDVWTGRHGNRRRASKYRHNDKYQHLCVCVCVCVGSVRFSLGSNVRPLRHQHIPLGLGFFLFREEQKEEKWRTEGKKSNKTESGAASIVTTAALGLCRYHTGRSSSLSDWYGIASGMAAAVMICFLEAVHQSGLSCWSSRIHSPQTLSGYLWVPADARL